MPCARSDQAALKAWIPPGSEVSFTSSVVYELDEQTPVQLLSSQGLWGLSTTVPSPTTRHGSAALS